MPCGCETKATFPAEATAPACYGHGVRALAAYLAVHQHLPYGRMAELFRDLLGIEISVGALAQMVAEAGALTDRSPTRSSAAAQADAVHFDETGGRVAGKLHWVHSASTSLLTLLDCHPKRGRVAMDDLGVIDQMTGIAHPRRLEALPRLRRRPFSVQCPPPARAGRDRLDQPPVLGGRHGGASVRGQGHGGDGQGDRSRPPLATALCTRSVSVTA